MPSVLSRRFAALAVTCLAALALPASAQQAPPADPLRLRPGDAVRVEVRDEPGLAGDYPVDEQGVVLLPVLGRVAVADRPFAEVRDALLAEFVRELSDPEVRVTPLMRVAVLGEVRRPGLFTVDPTHTLADALALAGGLTESAGRGGVTLVRDGRVVVSRLAPESAAMREPLRSGDRIHVERRGWLSENSSVLVAALASVTAAAVTSLLIR